ncbi:MAG: hypothetical protein JWM99_1837 [Verrucomicrobiales bacterium]|nr:hypothetical protein [Verrucomicrobiales bacterium]
MNMLAMLTTVDLSILLIPLLAIVLGCGIPLLWIYTDYRKRKDIFEMHHRERMAAIEKGISVPPLPDGFLDDLTGSGNKTCTPASALLKGLVWLFLGISLSIVIFVIRHDARACLGLIPASIGVAYLLFYLMEGRKSAAPSVNEKAG